jgi:hypothetical protein
MARHHMTAEGPIPFTPEEEAEKDAEEAAYAAGANDRVAEEVRSKRNQLLAASDWTQCKDISNTFSAIWAVYREDLRNVPQQAGFPWNVTWPSQPE